MSTLTRLSSSPVVASLEALGRAEYGECNEEPNTLADYRAVWRELLCGLATWETYAADRSPEELRDLIRGVILYSRAVNQALGGSVSPVIVLYRAMVRSRPIWEPEFTRWVVDHRVNRWEPFGSPDDGEAKTYDEYLLHRERIGKARAIRRAVGESRQAVDQQAKKQRERIEATDRLAAAVTRGDVLAVKALLAKGAVVGEAVPNSGSLVELALHHGRQEVADLLASMGVR